MAVTTEKAPWHHWPVAVVALAFYAIGAVDYTFSKLGFGFYLSRFPEPQQEFILSMSTWLSAVWAVGVWGGLWGAWLHLTRNRFSVPLLFLGAAALVFMTVWLSLFTRPTIFGMAGFAGFYTMLGSAAIATLIYLYARWERSERKLG